VLASADPPEAQLAMNLRWHLPFRWVSDPSGEELARPLGFWNADERGGVMQPFVLLVAPDGRTLVEHRSRDFADREDDEDVIHALRALGRPARAEPVPWEPGVEPKPTESAFGTEAFGPYFRGVRSCCRALAPRMREDDDAAELWQTERMARSFLAAWRIRRSPPR
jgi:hypothetical protein